MELLLLIIAVLLFMIFYRLGTMKEMFFKWITYLDKEFNSDDLKVLRYLIYDLDKIMPFIVEKKQYEKRKWDFEEEERKEEEEARIDMEFMKDHKRYWEEQKKKDKEDK